MSTNDRFRIDDIGLSPLFTEKAVTKLMGRRSSLYRTRPILYLRADGSEG
jgi:hypothetical protein